jgi:hypothetical protein
MVLAMMSGVGEIAQSPFIVPVAGCIMVLGIVVAGNLSNLRKRELEGRERLEMIARGIAPPPTAEELALTHSRPVSSQSRRRANIRLTGIVLLASAAGIIAFFVALAAILRQRDVLSGAAVGLIPFAVGLGFLIDARHQARDIEAADGQSPSDRVR